MALARDDISGLYHQFMADIQHASLQMIPTSSISTWQTRIEAMDSLIQEVWLNSPHVNHVSTKPHF